MRRRDRCDAEAMNATAQEKLIDRVYNDMWNRFDQSVFAEILHPGIRFRGSLGQEKVGFTEFGEYVDFIRAFSPDFHNTVLSTITEANQTFARLSYTGTHQGKIFGVEPAGQSFSTRALPSFCSKPTASQKSGSSATSTDCSNS